MERKAGSGLGLGRRGHSARTRRRGQHHPPGPDRLRRPRQRRGGRRLGDPQRPGQIVRHGRFVREPAGQASRSLARSQPTAWTCRPTGASSASTPTARPLTACGPGDVAMLTGYSGFRPAATRIRRRERASTSSWRNRSPPIRRAAAGDQGRRGGREEEPEDRRRPAVPPLAQPPGTHQAHARRRTGRDPAHPRLPHAGRRRLGAKPPDEKELFWQIRNFTSSSGSPAACSPK